MTDQAGAVVDTRQYDAWGNLEVGANRPGYAYTGREWDPETGLYYYRASLDSHGIVAANVQADIARSWSKERATDRSARPGVRL